MTCNYTECLHSISRNNDVVYHQNGVKISLSEGNLHHKSTQISSGGDKFGSYVQIFQEWAFENQLLSTSVRNYENMAIFTQHYPAGLKNISLGNHVITKTNFPLIAKHPPHLPSSHHSISLLLQLHDMTTPRTRGSRPPQPGQHRLAQPPGQRDMT